MASSYALPASAMTHSHHGHGHGHSHSHSPGRHSANTPRSMKQERSNGSLHSHSASESHLSHIHEHPHNHSHEHEPLPAPSSQSEYFEAIDIQRAHTPIMDDPFGMTEDLPARSSLYRPLLNSDNVIPHAHHSSSHHHTTPASAGPRSRITTFILPYTLRWPILHAIMAEKDSRRIFYFMSLNFFFMLIQAFYGYVTDSLGLLSDSIHMLFDCVALGFGLLASVASKWPPSEQFPYGFGMIEALSGFGNGVFLMLISVEIMVEAAERLVEGHATTRRLELFIVSTLGLLVNLVGMAAFGHHGHAGHDHGSHGHDHGHDHGHSHGHENHDHDDHANHSHGVHSHSHDNENMHGIFLHILADTMGSGAVIISTVVDYYTGWKGADPVASFLIAVLIFAAAVPLTTSCAKKLLLTVPDPIEYNLREALGGVGELRGVASYAAPRFWMGDKNTESEKEQVLGVIHIITTRGSDLDDVKERARAYLQSHGMDVVVQVERDGDASCWCGGSSSRSPARFS